MREEILKLLREFVDFYSKYEVDIQFCNHRFPPSIIKVSYLHPLPFDPFHRKTKEDLKRIAHYFLFVASINQCKVIGRAENAREIIGRLYEHLGPEGICPECWEKHADEIDGY